MKIRLLAVLFTLFFFFGCQSATQQKYHYPNFTHQQTVVGTVISDQVILPPLVLDMEVTEEYFLVLCLHNGKWLHIFDKNSGAFIKSLFTHGRGPGEILSAIQFSLDKHQKKLSIFDREVKKLLTIDINSLMEGVPKSRVVSNDYFVKAEGVFPLRNDTLVFKPFVRISLDEPTRYFRLSGEQPSIYYNEYPVEDVFAPLLYIDFKQTISPDMTKMAVGTLMGAILEIFDISEGLELISTSYYSEPVLDDSGRYLAYENSGLGFVDLYGTDRYIYSSFSGKKNLEYYNDIAIFDWDGNPITLHNTEYNLLKICTEPDDSTVYSLGIDKDSGEYVFISFPFLQNSKLINNTTVHF